MKAKFATFIILFAILVNEALAQDYCSSPQKYYDVILKEVANKNPSVIDNLPECLKQDRNLIFKVLLLDKTQFQNASENLHQDKIFIKRIIKSDPDILKYVAPEVRADSYFMEEAIYINRDALKYSSWALLDNRLFMKKMIDLDSDNYRFASDRIKSFEEFARPALEDNGLLLEFSPPNVKANKEFVKIAVNSDRNAIKFANPKLALDQEIIDLAMDKDPLLPSADLEKYLHENYIGKHEKKNLGEFITNKAKFSKNAQIIDHNFITKWKKAYNIEKVQIGEMEEEWRLNSVDHRNYQSSWVEDFKAYPSLIKRIEKFFAKRHIVPDTISDLRTIYLWKIKDDPLTLVFNLYGISSTNDEILAQNFANITSLTAIAQLQDKKWRLSIVDVIFNREVRISALYEGGHKKYALWDLYQVNEKDKNSKLIFKVEDAICDYFQIFKAQPNGRYKMAYQSKKIQCINQDSENLK
jgi:hypothetical protein